MQMDDTGAERTTGAALFKVLGDDVRWRIVQQLRRGDRSVVELVRRVSAPQNLVSYHLQTLRDAGLVRSHKSEADGRTVYYGLDLSRLGALYRDLDETLRISDPGDALAPGLTVLFLCTSNSARSQMAEGWLRSMVPAALRVRSAGMNPDSVHPLAVEVMAERGIDIGYQFAKSRDDLDGLVADLIVTVCDRAREQCPPESEGVMQIHWSIADPARVEGSTAQRREAFRAARDDIEQRVRGLLRLLPQHG